MSPRFLAEPAPARHEALPTLPGIARMVANNPGPMTYHGTNAWLVDTQEGRVVIDPGPDDQAQIAALTAAGPIALILLTHFHHDHADAAPALSTATGAPVAAFTTSPVPADRRLADGELIAGLRAIHTPGHAADHLCFAHSSGALVSGDHVMGWSSSVVSRPDGDMAAYLASLDRLLAAPHAILLPGHGPAITDPAPHIAALRAHRLAREAAIEAALGNGPTDEATLLARIYPDLPEKLEPAAARTLAAHLAKLAAEGRIRRAGPRWTSTPHSP